MSLPLFFSWQVFAIQDLNFQCYPNLQNQNDLKKETNQNDNNKEIKIPFTFPVEKVSLIVTSMSHLK